MKKILSFLIFISAFITMFVLTASANAAPDSPDFLTATSTKNSITVSWYSANGADGYRIYYKTPASISWKKCVSSTTKTTHTFSNLAQGYTCSIAVRSYCIDDFGNVIWGDYSEIDIATKPAATSSITTAQNANAVKLTWAPVKGATHYRVYQKVNGSWQSLGYTTDVTKTISNLKAGTKYSFAVRSYINLVPLLAGDYRTINTATKPATPKNVKATASGTTVNLTWNKVNGANGYRIYYRTSEFDNWKTVVSSMTDTSISWKNLNVGTTYYFAVKPYIKTESGIIWGSYVETFVEILSLSGFDVLCEYIQNFGYTNEDGEKYIARSFTYKGSGYFFEIYYDALLDRLRFEAYCLCDGDNGISVGVFFNIDRYSRWLDVETAILYYYNGKIEERGDAVARLNMQDYTKDTNLKFSWSYESTDYAVNNSSNLLKLFLDLALTNWEYLIYDVCYITLSDIGFLSF